MRLLKAQNTNLRSITGKGVKYGSDGVVLVDTNKSMIIPKGTTAERPDNAIIGSIRYNTDLDKLELYNGNDWETISNNTNGSMVDSLGVKYVITFTG